VSTTPVTEMRAITRAVVDARPQLARPYSPFNDSDAYAWLLPVPSWQLGTVIVCRYDAWPGAVEEYSSTDAAAPEVRRTRRLPQLGGEGSCTADGVTDAVGVDEDVEVAVGVGEDVAVCVAVVETVEDGDGVVDAVAAAVPVAEYEEVGEMPAGRLAEADPVCVCVGVPVCDGVDVGVAVELGVGSAGTGMTPISICPDGAAASCVKPSPTLGDASNAVLYRYNRLADVAEVVK
jgi:hypothetical protein